MVKEMSKTSFCILYFLLSFLALSSSLSFAGQKDSVVVLHGIARSSSSMETLVEHIEGKGYQVLNLDYPSTDYRIEDLIVRIHKQINAFNRGIAHKIHFVGYSMSCLLVRGLLNKYRPDNLGRVVMLAPPNLGSEAADFWKDNWVYQKIYGPAGQQLVTDQKDLGKILGRVDYELGVIARDSSIDPLHSYIIPGPDDGKVAIARTMIDGTKDHIIIHASHTFIIYNKNAFKQTTHFLGTGEFQKTDDAD
jgi:triacylglycerol esterase/lipase EstA (alpha/beta hydrolase family)